MPINPAFPTILHQQAASAIIDYFAALPKTLAVLLVNSCARGVAIPESDLDMAILVDPALSQQDQDRLERQWLEYYAVQPTFAQFKQLGKFSVVHISLFNGLWSPQRWDEGGGPDIFEIEIGNQVAHAAPLWQRADAFSRLQSNWLPYYSPELQRESLDMVRASCQFNMARMRSYVGRGLYFQAFDRLYHAFQEFLQALFIARAVYPIAYNKWIHEQVVDWLGLPELYAQLPEILQINDLQSDELLGKSDQLLLMLDTWTTTT